jgi:hypothetical protein
LPAALTTGARDANHAIPPNATSIVTATVQPTHRMRGPLSLRPTIGSA